MFSTLVRVSLGSQRERSDECQFRTQRELVLIVIPRSRSSGLSRLNRNLELAKPFLANTVVIAAVMLFYHRGQCDCTNVNVWF